MKQLFKVIYSVCFIICICQPLLADEIMSRPYIVDIPRIEPPPDDFIVQLLRMSLEASKHDGEEIQLRFAKYGLSQARLMAEVQRGDSNSVMWTISNNERESLLRPIRIPLFKGLLGYRTLVIRKEDAARFATIKTRADLAKYTAGQGAEWPDTQILRSNKLPVAEGSSHNSLYKMLAAGRFDYFPRGITETREEADLIQKYDVLVEPHITLYYPTVMYFFVYNDNKELAQRLEKGLTLLEKRGDFDRLFYALPRVQAALTELSDDARTTISLSNPELSAKTKTYPPEYWRKEAQRYLLHSSASAHESRH